MKKDVFITIKSIQTVENEQDITELSTFGSLYRREKDKDKMNYVITYDESEATGFEGSKTTLTLDGDERVTLIRSGSTSSNLIIEKDKKHHCHYGTLYGDFMLGITAEKIESTVSDIGGDIYFKYTIDINSGYVSENEIYVNIKEVEKRNVESN